MRTFKVGDQVKLNSGGPVLTVEKAEAGKVVCQWFDGKKARKAEFPTCCVHQVEGDE